MFKTLIRRQKRVDPATKIRLLMAESNLSVTELAELAGLHRNTISAIRNGDTDRPNIDTQYRIAEALRTRPERIWD